VHHTTKLRAKHGNKQGGKSSSQYASYGHRSSFRIRGRNRSEKITPKGQAEEIVKLMRRSVLMHEFKERVLWDEDADPGAAAEERVGICGLHGGEGKGGEEGRIMGEWIEDALDV